MKTWKLFLCSLVPMAFGELTNRLILVPFLGTLLFYAAPLVMAAFCLWLGLRCARDGVRFLPALLLTQWLNVLSLVLYVWQFHFVSSDTRSLFLAGLAQDPAASFLLISGKVAWLLNSDNVWGAEESLVMVAVSVALLLVLFSCGYLAERVRRSRAAG